MVSYTSEELKQIINDINVLYAQKGIISAKAYIPTQTFKDNTVTIKLLEARVGKIIFEGNKRTRQGYINKFLKQQKEGDLLSIQELSDSIQRYNRNNVSTINANLSPGKEFATTDITIKVEETTPVQLAASFTNLGRSTTGELIGTPLLSVSNIVGVEDRFYMGYSGSRSSHGAFAGYSLPLNDKWRTDLGFGFNTVEVTSGPFRPLNIRGESLNYSWYLTRNLIDTPSFTLETNLGVNFKEIASDLLSTRVTKNQIRTLSTGINAAYRRKTFSTYLSNNFVNGLDILGGNARFFKYVGNLVAVKQLPQDILFILRGSTQLTDDRLPSAEQFQIGGAYTVRGYSEGLFIGDNGYIVSGELRFPIPLLPVEINGLRIKDNIKAAVFSDHAGAFPDDGSASAIRGKQMLTSVGLGLRVNLSKYISSRLDWGFGIGNRERPQPTARFHFGLEGRTN